MKLLINIQSGDIHRRLHLQKKVIDNFNHKHFRFHSKIVRCRFQEHFQVVYMRRCWSTSNYYCCKWKIHLVHLYIHCQKKEEVL